MKKKARVRPALPDIPNIGELSMKDLTWVLSGGFAKGYRTYIIAGLAVASAVASYATGDTDLMHTVQNVALSLGLGTLRAAK